MNLNSRAKETLNDESLKFVSFFFSSNHQRQRSKALANGRKNFCYSRLLSFHLLFDDKKNWPREKNFLSWTEERNFLFILMPQSSHSSAWVVLNDHIILLHYLFHTFNFVVYVSRNICLHIFYYFCIQCWQWWWLEIAPYCSFSLNSSFFAVWILSSYNEMSRLYALNSGIGRFNNASSLISIYVCSTSRNQCYPQNKIYQTNAKSSIHELLMCFVCLSIFHLPLLR